MKSRHRHRHLLLTAAWIFSAALPALASPDRSVPVATVSRPEVSQSRAPEPGPENGGLRLRLTLTPASATASGKCRVQADVVNVSAKPLTLRGAWEYDEDKGDLKDYIAAAIGIETHPAIEPWSGQTRAGERSAPQPELTLKPNESVSVEWDAADKKLKTRVSDPHSVPNPEFPQPGLYSVHAVLALSTGGEPVLLRSNEQFFSVGGGNTLPKSTYGQIYFVSVSGPSAYVNLGSLQKVQKGDQFRIRTGYSEYFRLSISTVMPSWSEGVLFAEPLSLESSKTVPWPTGGQGATLADSKLPVPDKLPPPPRPLDTSLLDSDKAAGVPVVLRVQFVSESGADKYGWSKVRLVATFKNESQHTFPQEFEVAHVGSEPGVPAGLSTIYLERYNKDSEDRWKLLGGSAASSVSHHQKP